MSFLNYGKWIGFALVAAFIGFQCLRIANLETTVAEQSAQLVADNATIAKYQEDQAAKHAVIAALQGQVEDVQDILTGWQVRAVAQDKIIAGLRNQPAGPKQAAKEVVDDEGSRDAIDDINRGWDRWLRPPPARDNGVSGAVYPVRPTSATDWSPSGP